MQRLVKIALWMVVFAAVLVAATAAAQSSYTFVQALARGQTLYVSCDGAQRLRADRLSELVVVLSCGRPEQATPTATAIVEPTATNTPAPVPPTATPEQPTPTATPGTPPSGPVPVEPASMLGTCDAATHDRYVVERDGRLWRTWHPQTVTKADGSTCTFAHEHGDDPATSQADSSLPAFGYVGSLVGLNEPHEGFKVYVVNRGARNDEGRTAQVSTRGVVHMSTARPLPGMTGGRFTMPFHSLEFDMISPTGHEVHVEGMANTFDAGSICERDARSQSNNPVGRTLYIDPAVNTCAANSPYEIWQLVLNMTTPDGQRGAYVIFSAAAFDTGTALNTATGQAVATGMVGCDREAYHGPVYWYNANGPTSFRTDAYGRPDANGPLVQMVSRHNAIGIPFSNDQTLFKFRRDFCAPGLAIPN